MNSLHQGYPPSVISMIPSLIERTGNGIKNEGSITTFYTVLADSDDHNISRRFS